MATDAQKQELIDKLKYLVENKFGGDYKVAFNHYDVDKDGKVDITDINNILTDANIGNYFTRGLWANGIMTELDKDADGFITIKEFEAAIPHVDIATPEQFDALDALMEDVSENLTDWIASLSQFDNFKKLSVKEGDDLKDGIVEALREVFRLRINTKR